MWGFWLGYLYSLIGALIGSVLTYYIARILGHDAMHLIFGEEKIKKWLVHLNSKKAVIIVFFIFLIPGVPKDLCNYVAGLSEIKLKPFLIESLIGRSPGMMGSLLIVLCVLCVIFRKRFTGLLNKGYDKLMKM